MSYPGLVPSEATTGQQRRLGSITKTRSGHARRLLVQAAWHYRHPPRLAPSSTAASTTSQQLIAISWKTQQRLYQLWRRLDTKRGKRRELVAVAIARHLAGFCWAIVNADPHTDSTHDTDRHPDASLVPRRLG